MADWASQEWRAEAVAWLDESLAAVGMTRSGEVTQPHLRPWATALRAPTDRGPVWLKAPGPGTAFEVLIYPVIHRAAGESVLEPIAVDERRSWIVLPDGGPTLWQQAEENRQALVEGMIAAIGDYGRLQRHVQPFTAELLARGVPDMRPEVMPLRFAEAADSVAAFADDGASEDDRAAYRRALALRPEFDRWCERLASSPLGGGLDHHDLHPGNILGEPGEPAMFYDWGDAVVAHPFACMLVPLQYVVSIADADAVVRLRDEYLRAFDDVAPRDELAQTLDLACRVAKAARTLTWQRALAAVQEPEHEFAAAPLQTFVSLEKESYRS
ncbi:MAG: phosphotransferase [Thermocrispum sp.]